MRIKRIFVQEKVINKRNIIITEKGIIHRLKDVLRFREGETLNIFNYQYGEYFCKIKTICDKKIVLDVIKKLNTENIEPKIKINLFQAIIKKDKFEFVVEKTTEAGVFSITPVITDYTVKTNLNLERLNKIAIEAAEQSGRISIPTIKGITTFKNAIGGLKNNNQISTNFLFDIGGQPLKELIKYAKSKEEINIFVGPEGGFSEQEINLAKNLNIKIASFGTQIWKSETIGAVIIGYIINY